MTSATSENRVALLIIPPHLDPVMGPTRRPASNGRTRSPFALGVTFPCQEFPRATANSGEMKLSFATHTAPTSWVPGAWSLEECADWAREHGFDAVRLTAAGLGYGGKAGLDAVTGSLRARGLFLAALT